MSEGHSVWRKSGAPCALLRRSDSTRGSAADRLLANAASADEEEGDAQS